MDPSFFHTNYDLLKSTFNFLRARYHPCEGCASDSRTIDSDGCWRDNNPLTATGSEESMNGIVDIGSNDCTTTGDVPSARDPASVSSLIRKLLEQRLPQLQNQNLLGGSLPRYLYTYLS